MPINDVKLYDGGEGFLSLIDRKSHGEYLDSYPKQLSFEVTEEDINKACEDTSLAIDPYHRTSGTTTNEVIARRAIELAIERKLPGTEVLYEHKTVTIRSQNRPSIVYRLTKLIDNWENRMRTGTIEINRYHLDRFIEAPCPIKFTTP